MILHLVLFTPKPTLDAESLRSFAQVILTRLREIDVVGRAFVGRNSGLVSYGTQVGLKTYEYAAVVELAGKDELNQYLTHPSHGGLAAAFWQICEETLILDLEGGLVDQPRLVDDLV